MHRVVTMKQLIDSALAGRLSNQQALQLADCDDTQSLMQAAASLRDKSFGNVVTYSKKVFFPLTHLCRDVCHYCTFAQTPKFIEQAYMPLDKVLEQAREAAKIGCKEALLTLGEKPEMRYKTAREALANMGFESTLHYVAYIAENIYRETGILPHINAGNMTTEEVALLRPHAASMGLMLESSSARLCQKGMPHYGSPDKDPKVRIETLRQAGVGKVPMTTGLLIGIGETRQERIETLLAIRDVHEEFGHIQEVIVQNFRAKPNTKMANAPEPSLEELLWTIAVARLVLGAEMSIQAPPNLSPGVLEQLVDAGINDWGGVSPVTPDFVNPEAPWPNLLELADKTALSGKLLQERLTIYPRYISEHQIWLDKNFHSAVLAAVDGQGLPREDAWLAGQSEDVPAMANKAQFNQAVSSDVAAILAKAKQGLDEQEIVRLFQARGSDFHAVCEFADALRQEAVGETITYTVNRNINYTNVCYFKCTFCAFSKGKLSENLRGKPYDITPHEIKRRTQEAWQRGATEVCMQGGIHPSYDGDTYVAICKAVKEAEPSMHIHAFSPLEVWQGAATLNLSLKEFLQRLKDAGLGTLPGTAAEILDDEVRALICPDKVNTAQWLEVMRNAHELGIRTTATIMFGHVDAYQHWARHLLRIRALQLQTGGFTEFVPLPFVASEAPMFLHGLSRKGPTFREAMLMHAVARIALWGALDNIQASWVKLGQEGVRFALQAGANDLGGTLMNESITRSAGASHGEELGVDILEGIVASVPQRTAKMRNTLYLPVSEEREQAARQAQVLSDIELQAPGRMSEKSKLLKPGKSLDPRDSIAQR